jgi:AcrR family transcriptional regulator
MSSRKRDPLTRERVVEQAIELADRDGVDALTMRKLGAALGVEAMSLYRHVANKAELVAAMVDSVVAQFELPDDEPRWDAAIRRCAVSAHDLLVAHPWACRLALFPSGGPSLTSPRLRYMEWLLRTLRNAGFSAEIAYSAYHTLDSHIFGFTLWQLGHADATRNFRPPEGESADEWLARLLEQARPRFPFLVEHGEQHIANGADNQQEYEFGLDLILQGLNDLRLRCSRRKSFALFRRLRLFGRDGHLLGRDLARDEGDVHLVARRAVLVRLARDEDRRARLELAAEHVVGERVLDVALDRAAQRPGAHCRVVTLVDEQLLRLVGELDRDVVLRHLLP